MKALILSGGRGTRLRPITHTSAKQLVPVANKPILYYALEAVAAAGILEVGIIVGDTAAEVQDAVGDGSRWGVVVTYIPQVAPLGLAHAVWTAREWLGGDSFVMFLGDNLVKEGVTAIVRRFQQEDADALILLARVREPERFGVAELDEAGRVVRLAEKPEVPLSDLALVGVYLFTPKVHGAIDRLRPSPRGELEITDAIQILIDDGSNVVSQVIDGWWKDTGRLEDMLEANRMILDTIASRVDGVVSPDVRLEGRVVVERGAVLKDCTVRGPAIIGERTVVERAYIGPYTSISSDCVVRDAEIEHSIILEGSRIEAVEGKVESSLIGKNCVVCRSASRPHAMKLMLGDHSRIEA